MFSNLTDFKRKRKAKEAVGFYIAYFVVLLILIIGLSYLQGLVTGDNSYGSSFKLGNAAAIILSLILSFLIIIKKKLTGNFFYLLLAVEGGGLGAYGGLLICLSSTA